MPAARRRARLGQHFLYSPGILDRIARAAGEAARDAELIVEIGAGPGTLTSRLLGIGKRVLAIEIDRKLAESLRAKLGSPPDLEVLATDALELDLGSLIAARTAGRAVVAGNLPYYITSPILHRVCNAASRVAAAVVLVQKEVAARITARPGTRDYGYLSVLCRAHGRPEVLFTVPPGAFRPAPKVTSALVCLTIEPCFEQWGVDDREAFLQFVQLCFHHKRKTLLNNLQGRYAKARLAGMPEMRLRAEQLAPEQLAALWMRLTRP